MHYFICYQADDVMPKAANVQDFYCNCEEIMF